MAAAHGSATHLAAGPMAPSAPVTADEVQEYERILKISDDIFWGLHPRLKVPQQFVRKSTTRNGQPAPVAQTQPAKTKPKTTPKKTPASQPPAAATPPPPRVAPKPASEINPIFLTKSDDLVRAELQLQRQRVERALRDQVEQKKQETKQKLLLQDTNPGFDVEEVLNRALELVKPLSLSDPSEATGPGDDDNSFYSSRAPDSPPQIGDHQRPSPVARGLGHKSDELQRLEALNPPGSDQEMHDAYPVADQRSLNVQKQQPRHGHAGLQQPVEPLEEPEYSPPAPTVPPVDYQDDQRGARGRRRVSDGRFPVYSQEMRRPPSPANGIRVVQNHITSPAAPRPSRVSPLATKKAPAVQQLRDERTGYRSDQVYSDPDSARGSPTAPAPNVISRKRRRLDGGSGHASVAAPTEIYIKQEPVSPPPFADDPEVLRGRQRQEQPVYIDSVSPRYTPVAERREPVYETQGYHEPALEPGPSRTSSRLSTRRPVRDDGDLRRVANIQYARQSDYPREHIDVHPSVARSASYTVVDRPRYYEEAPPSYSRRYVAVDEPPTTYQEPYYEEVPSARTMAPPPRRIVVDEHGTQYIEMVPAQRTQPMAPPPRPMSQVSRSEVYEDRAPLRSASMRAPSVVQDAYGEHRYVQEMPPPQPVYRRVVSDYARPTTSDRRIYAAPPDGHETTYSRPGSVQVAEYAPRQPAYYEEYNPPPPERIIRTTSVRPQPTRYDEPQEVVQRAGSVRPTGQGRETSIYVEDRRAVGYRAEEPPVGEYWNRPVYVPAPRPVRERRYYEGEDGRHIASDGASDLVQRGSQRY
ncbi:uncharacterized protein PFLUO_LOCUS2378 [Penicillium psychrofluorescens]|uniref:uncharacterized protein n=1 Tax=Penicillium psychrofluorescens TaxID=3158075 RepID=UPI003CCCF0FE